MLVMQADHKAGAAPKFNVMTIDKPLCLGDGLGIVRAKQRFESAKMSVVPDEESPILDHPESPLRMSHPDSPYQI
jgi:hypothetical protein